MSQEQRPQPRSFPLRLSLSLMEAVRFLANKDGISMNHFIQMALAEKLARLEMEEKSKQLQER